MVKTVSEVTGYKINIQYKNEHDNEVKKTIPLKIN
jgi:hypothetical protein